MIRDIRISRVLNKIIKNLEKCLKINKVVMRDI